MSKTYAPGDVVRIVRQTIYPDVQLGMRGTVVPSPAGSLGTGCIPVRAKVRGEERTLFLLDYEVEACTPEPVENEQTVDKNMRSEGLPTAHEGIEPSR